MYFLLFLPSLLTWLLINKYLVPTVCQTVGWTKQTMERETFLKSYKHGITHCVKCHVGKLEVTLKEYYKCLNLDCLSRDPSPDTYSHSFPEKSCVSASMKLILPSPSIHYHLLIYVSACMVLHPRSQLWDPKPGFGASLSSAVFLLFVLYSLLFCSPVM